VPQVWRCFTSPHGRSALNNSERAPLRIGPAPLVPNALLTPNALLVFRVGGIAHGHWGGFCGVANGRRRVGVRRQTPDCLVANPSRWHRCAAAAAALARLTPDLLRLT